MDYEILVSLMAEYPADMRWFANPDSKMCLCNSLKSLNVMAERDSPSESRFRERGTSSFFPIASPSAFNFPPPPTSPVNSPQSMARLVVEKSGTHDGREFLDTDRDSVSAGLVLHSFADPVHSRAVQAVNGQHLSDSATLLGIVAMINAEDVNPKEATRTLRRKLTAGPRLFMTTKLMPFTVTGLAVSSSPLTYGKGSCNRESVYSRAPMPNRRLRWREGVLASGSPPMPAQTPQTSDLTQFTPDQAPYESDDVPTRSILLCRNCILKAPHEYPYIQRLLQLMG
ncbi:hypothetical protein EDB81DRAFT_759425 [Dactylonectria macrodidyma]|uniref:Uncharacterized protein n=1 Tax=Dactylonectria macrodidyma TaxID=307937 RepID=A0A9P9J692_9HYPO|nr:hypothetical protein EDB81DRAFT_759425 [Dactylonectria macrodidyma]